MKWISVKDQMPDTEVLLLTTSQVCVIGDWYGGGWRTDKDTWHDDVWYRNYDKDDITHWMPLPEPPNE